MDAVVFYALLRFRRSRTVIRGDSVVTFQPRLLARDPPSPSIPTTMAYMTDCLIAFGANEGDPAKTFRETESLLRNLNGVSKLRPSSIHQTDPVGGPAGQSVYLNAAFRLSTSWTAKRLHQALIDIETSLGRQRHQRWGSRKVDLDLLLYGEQEFQVRGSSHTAELVVPHPRMSFRRFVLLPAVEVAADLLHASSGLTIGELVQHLDSTPQHIIWITDDTRAAEKICERVQNELKSKWKFSIVQPVQAMDQFGRLLVFDTHDFEVKYCQPVLDLSEYDSRRKKIELLAAIEAMI